MSPDSDRSPLDARIPEPELMDEPSQVLAYASADFEDVNRGFVERFARTFPGLGRIDVIDLGCGPADITRRLAAALPDARVIGIDGALEMLRLGRRRSIGNLVAARVPSLPFASGVFEAVVSNSLFHHLPEADVAWREIRRVGRPGGALFVMDLYRPATREAARHIVDAAAANEREVLRRDFYNSLLAAFRVEEVRAQLARAGLGHCACEIVSERHWLVSGRLR